MQDDTPTTESETPSADNSMMSLTVQSMSALSGDGDEESTDEPTSDKKVSQPETEDGEPADENGDEKPKANDDELTIDSIVQEGEEDNEPDAEDPAAFITGALEEYEGATPERKAEIQKGIQKQIRTAKSDKSYADGWRQIEQGLIGSIDGAKVGAKQLIQFLASHHKVEVKDLLEELGVTASGESAPLGGEPTSDFDVEKFIEDEDFDHEVSTAVRTLAKEFSKQVNDLKSQVASKEQELKAKEEVPETPKKGATATELRTEFNRLVPLFSQEFNGFTLKESDFAAAIKAKPDLSREDAVRLYVQPKLLQHAAEQGRKTSAKVPDMPKPNGSKPGGSKLGAIMRPSDLSIGKVARVLGE